MTLIEQADKLLSVLNVFNLQDSKVREKKLLFLSSMFYRLGVTPNFLTLLTLFFVMLAGSLILYKQVSSAAVAFFVFLFFSCYDGIYARHTASESKFGDIFNNMVNLLGDLFLLVPILIDSINSASYFVVNVLLGLLTLRILVMALQIQLHAVKVKTNALFFGRTGMFVLILLGFVTRQIPLAVIGSTIFLALSFLQLLARAYCQLYRVAPRVTLKIPVKPKHVGKNIQTPKSKPVKEVKNKK